MKKLNKNMLLNTFPLTENVIMFLRGNFIFLCDNDLNILDKVQVNYDFVG